MMKIWASLLKLTFLWALIFVSSGCVTSKEVSEKNLEKVHLNSNAQRDYLVVRADLFTMNGDWLQAQLDLESALAIEDSGELRLRHALVMAQRGQFEPAEEELKNLFTLDEMKNNVEAYLAYGEVLALQNKAEESLNAYKKALSLDKNNYKAIIFLGAIYSQLKNYKLARDYFNRLKFIEDYKHLSGYYLGRLEQQLEHFSTSEKYFDECLKVKPDFTDCIFSLVESLNYQKKTKKSIAKLNEFVENNPDSDRAFAKLYDLYLEEGDQEKAFQQLVQLERFEPQNIFIKMQMALHLVENHEDDSAIVKLKEVSELSPNFGKTYFLLSTIYDRKGDAKKAKYYYSRISKKQPIYIEASIQRAKEIEQKEGMESALKFLKNVDNDSHDTRVYLYISILENKLGQVEKSLNTLRQALLKVPNDVQVLYFLGHLEGEAGQMGRAILNMKRVVQLDPEHSDALNYLAFYYAENKILLDDAEKFAKKAIQIKPNDGHFLDTLGWIYYQKGQFEQAQNYLEKAYNLNPEEAVIAEHLAAVYSVKGLKDKAKKVYTILMEKGLGDREKIQRQINSISSQK